jgi:ankyrin repeat protein
MKALIETGKLTDDSLATMLLRKADWHDQEGIKLLLEAGADPNRQTQWGKTALHNAILSDNAIEILQALLDHGGDPTILPDRPDKSYRSTSGRSTVSIAARRGRRDVLDLFERRAIPMELEGVEQLIAACASNDAAHVRTIAMREPQLVRELVAEGGTLLSEFAGNGNTEGVRHLLDLGVPVTAVYEKGDGYFGIAPNSTALHVAAWRARPETVKLLIERGAPIEAIDGHGRTALQLAVLACVDSYWTQRRSPESVAALLQAGASVAGVRYPSGYADVDYLLKSHGAVG